MNSTKKSLFHLISGFAALVLGSALPAFSQMHVEINFSQQYAFTNCASTVPDGDSCLAVNLAANPTELGPVTVARTAFFNGSLYNPSLPTCMPIETTGTVSLREGTLTIHGIGNVCFVDGTGSYNLIIAGGTGRFKGAIGGGQITVPPPTSNSTGRELWSFNLYLNEWNK